MPCHRVPNGWECEYLSVSPLAADGFLAEEALGLIPREERPASLDYGSDNGVCEDIMTPNLEKLGNEDLVQGPCNHTVIMV